MLQDHQVYTLRVIDPNYKELSDTDKSKLAEKYSKSISFKHVKVHYKNGAYIITGNSEVYYATLALGLPIVNVVIDNDLNDVKKSIITRLQKEVLNPMMSAFLYAELIEIAEMKQSVIAKTTGKTQGAISNKLRLLKLPHYVQEKLLVGEIKERHGRALLQLSKLDDFEMTASKLAYKIIKENLKVVEVEDFVDKLLGKKQKIRDALYITPINNRTELKNPANGMIIDKMNLEVEKTTNEIARLFPLLDIELVQGVDSEDYVFVLKLKGINNG